MSSIPSGIPVLLTAIIASVVTVHAEPRVWTNREGKTVSAELDSYDGKAKKIILKLAGGKTAVIPTDQLGEEDRQYLEEYRSRIEKDAADEKAKAGKTIAHRSDGPEQVTYHVYYPTGYDPAKPPAIIIMFSSSGSGKGILNSVKNGCEKLGWIGVGCDVFRNNFPEESLDKKWAEVLPHIEKTVKHDADLMYLGGMSGGALRAYDYSELTPRPWKGVLAFGGWMAGKPTLGCPPKMAVAVVNGDKDIANSRIEKENAIRKKAGCINKVFSFPGGHVVAPQPVVETAMRWLKDNTVPGNRTSKGKRSPTPENPDLKQ